MCRYVWTALHTRLQRLTIFHATGARRHRDLASHPAELRRHYTFGHPLSTLCTTRFPTMRSICCKLATPCTPPPVFAQVALAAASATVNAVCMGPCLSLTARNAPRNASPAATVSPPCAMRPALTLLTRQWPRSLHLTSAPRAPSLTSTHCTCGHFRMILAAISAGSPPTNRRPSTSFTTTPCASRATVSTSAAFCTSTHVGIPRARASAAPSATSRRDECVAYPSTTTARARHRRDFCAPDSPGPAQGRGPSFVDRNVCVPSVPVSVVQNGSVADTSATSPEERMFPGSDACTYETR